MDINVLIQRAWGIWFPVSILCLLLWLPIFPFTIFMFDAPGSEQSLLTNTLAFSVLSYGPVWVGSMVSSWLLRRCGRNKVADAARWISILPGIAFIVSFVAIDVLCGGSFVCKFERMHLDDPSSHH